MQTIQNTQSTQQTQDVQNTQSTQQTQDVQNTPPTLPQQYIGFWRRFLAYSVDGLILGIIGMAVNAPGGFHFTTSATQNVPTTNFGLSFLIGVAYFIFFWVNQNGQTLGNKLLAIRVVKESGQPMDIGSAVIRYIGYLVSAIVFCLGFLWVAWDSKKQGWHDKMAGTVVVPTDKKPHTVLAIFLVFGFLIIGVIAVVGLTLLAVVAGVKGGHLTQTSTAQYTQVQADQFSQQIFTLINQKRTADGLSPLNENQHLCVYVKKILTEAAGNKNFPWSQHFLEDTANPQFQQAYFSGFTQEFYEYTPTLPVDQAIPAANDWYTKKGFAINNASITDGCIGADPQNTFFIYAKSAAK